MKKLLSVLSVLLLAFPVYAQSTLYSNSTTGNVGIGTAVPQAALHVNGGTIVGNDTASCTGTNAGEIIWDGSNLQFCNGTSWQSLSGGGASPSGTWCGIGDNIYGPDANCLGYNPQSGCPSGYTQAHFAQYGGGALFVCVAN